MQVLALQPASDRPMARILWRPFSSLSCCHGRHDLDGTDVRDGVVIKQNHHLSNICAREQQCLLTADGQLFTVQCLFSVQLLGKAVCHSGSGEINLPKPCVGPAVGWTWALCGKFTGMEGYMCGGSYGPNVWVGCPLRSTCRQCCAVCHGGV